MKNIIEHSKMNKVPIDASQCSTGGKSSTWFFSKTRREQIIIKINKTI